MNLIRIASRVATEPTSEGEFAVPIGQLIATLQTLLSKKYGVEMAYRSFADRVKGPWRDSLVEHWSEHAKEERSMSYDLAMKVVGLGSDPIQTVVQIPPCVANIVAFCKCLAVMELEAIKTERAIIDMAGSCTALKVLMENHCHLDTQHLDDLRRMTVEIQN